MGEPLFTNTGSKIGSILLVIILTAAGGGLYLNQQSQIDFSGQIDLSTELQPDVDEPGWVGVGTGDLNFTEGAVIIMVADTAYPSSSGATTGDVVMQTLTDVIEEEVNEYCEKNGYMYRFDFVSYTMIVGDDGISGSISDIKEMGVELVVGNAQTWESIKSLDEIRENDLLFISTGTSTSKVTDTLDSYYGIQLDIPEEEIIPKVLAEKGIEAVIILYSDPGDIEDRDEYYSVKLYNGVSAYFEAIGGTIYKSIAYPRPRSMSSSNLELNEDFTEYITAADEAIRKAKDEYGEDKVGVVAFGGNEVHGMLYQGQDLEHFLSVPWFSYKLMTLIRGLDTAGEIAARTGFYAQRSILWNDETIAELSTKIEKRMNRTLHNNILASEKHALAYDACWLLALSVIEADSSEAADVESVFIDVAATYNGINGNYALDEHGDKIHCTGEICRVVEDPNKWYWQYDVEVIGYYDSPPGVLTVHDSFYENP